MLSGSELSRVDAATAEIAAAGTGDLAGPANALVLTQSEFGKRGRANKAEQRRRMRRLNRETTARRAAVKSALFKRAWVTLR